MEGGAVKVVGCLKEVVSSKDIIAMVKVRIHYSRSDRSEVPTIFSRPMPSKGGWPKVCTSKVKKSDKATEQTEDETEHRRGILWSGKYSISPCHFLETSRTVLSSQQGPTS